MHMAAILQSHFMDLQEYLNEWSEKQQRLLEMMSDSPAKPGTTLASAKGQTVTEQSCDGITIEIAKGSDGDIWHDVLPTSASHEGLPTAIATKDEQSPKSDASLSAQTHDDKLAGVDGFRNELVRKLEVSLNNLKELENPTRDHVAVCLTHTFDLLEDQITQIDMFSLSDPLQVSKSEEEHRLSKLEIAGKSESCYDKVRNIRCNVRQCFHALEGASAAVILLNGITMGISADQGIRNGKDVQITSLKTMEIGFVIYYTIEVTLRIAHEFKHFFLGADRLWNVFDLILVLTSLFDLLMTLFLSDSPIGNLSFLRLAKVIKMFRLFRMFRLMRMFRQLRLILASITGSLHACFWAVMLMILTTYMASILFMNLLTTFLSDASEQSLEVSFEIRRDIERFWGSIPTGMISLFGATTGGEDWFNIARPILEAGWASYGIFILYINFFLVVVLNTFASLFVQAVMENKEKDDNAMIEGEMRSLHIYIEKLRHFFTEIDQDHSGGISLKEFLRYQNDPRMLAWADSLDIDLSDAKHLFEILSRKGSLDVDFETFVEGCIKMKGQAKCIDVQTVLALSQQIHDRVDQCLLMLRTTKNQFALDQKVHEKEIADLKHASSNMLTQIFKHQEDMLRCFQQTKFEL